MKLIYETPSFRLDARATVGRVGRTVEIFQTFPQAKHPRAQRILCLTLPPDAAARMAALWLHPGDAT